MYAAGKIGASGKLLAVDLEPTRRHAPAERGLRPGDALSLDNEELARFAPYDVVLSDMAPQDDRQPHHRSGAQLRAVHAGACRCG